MEKFRELLSAPKQPEDGEFVSAEQAKEAKEAERMREKMLNLLISNYVDTHVQVPHSVGFLTGLKTYQTYLLKITIDRVTGNKREYAILRDNIKGILDELKAENNFEFDNNGIAYLIDLNPEKHARLAEYLKKEGPKSPGIELEIKKVLKIGEDEKRILSRRFQRGGR